MSNGNEHADLDQEINEAALRYHAEPVPGKISVTLTKPARTQRDLALAYSPGVAEPVRRIASEPQDAYRYTSKGNLVAVITDGSAVLGLGNVGALAGKPVMEGKGVLFKHFAGIDVFDIEVNAEHPQEFIETVMPNTWKYGRQAISTSLPGSTIGNQDAHCCTLALTFPWLSTAPLLTPVVPPVYMINAGSSVGLISTAGGSGLAPATTSSKKRWPGS